MPPEDDSFRPSEWLANGSPNKVSCELIWIMFIGWISTMVFPSNNKTPPDRFQRRLVLRSASLLYGVLTTGFTPRVQGLGTHRLAPYGKEFMMPCTTAFAICWRRPVAVSSSKRFASALFVRKTDSTSVPGMVDLSSAPVAN